MAISIITAVVVVFASSFHVTYQRVITEVPTNRNITTLGIRMFKVNSVDETVSKLDLDSSKHTSDGSSKHRQKSNTEDVGTKSKNRGKREDDDINYWFDCEKNQIAEFIDGKLECVDVFIDDRGSFDKLSNCAVGKKKIYVNGILVKCQDRKRSRGKSRIIKKIYNRNNFEVTSGGSRKHGKEIYIEEDGTKSKFRQKRYLEDDDINIWFDCENNQHAEYVDGTVRCVDVQFVNRNSFGELSYCPAGTRKVYLNRILIKCQARRKRNNG